MSDNYVDVSLRDLVAVEKRKFTSVSSQKYVSDPLYIQGSTFLSFNRVFELSNKQRIKSFIYS